MFRHFRDWSLILLLLLLLLGVQNTYADRECAGILCQRAKARDLLRTEMQKDPLADLQASMKQTFDWAMGKIFDPIQNIPNVVYQEGFPNPFGEGNILGGSMGDLTPGEELAADLTGGAATGLTQLAADLGTDGIPNSPFVMGRLSGLKSFFGGGQKAATKVNDTVEDMVTLYRGEGWDVGASPRVRMKGGIKPHGRSLPISESLDPAKAGREFVSTSTSPETAMRYTGKDGFGYIYEIQIPRSKLVDVNATYGTSVLKPHELEQLVRGGIDPKYIRRSFAVEHRQMTGQVYHNPSFVGGKNLPQGIPHVTETAFTRHLPENLRVR